MSKVVVLDFYANWCNPCKKLDPYLNELKIKFPSYEFKKINIEDDVNKDLVDIYGISALPTIIILEDSIIKHKIVGLDVSKLLNAISSL